MAPNSSSRARMDALMQAAANRLGAAGIERPLFEAQMLLAHAMRVSRGNLIACWPPEVAEDTVAEWLDLVEARSSRIPMAYLCGFREFYGHRMTVNRHVLVPRPETELLVERALAWVGGRHGAVVIDVCTGSGCVAAAIALNSGSAGASPSPRVYGSDLSARAIRVAASNLRPASSGSGAIGLVVADLLSAFAPGCADVVTANPPYVPTATISALEPEVRDHEPRLALDGGADGLALIRPLAHQARRVLRSGGVLLLEVGRDQAGAVGEVLRDAGFACLGAYRDLAGIPRVMEAQVPDE